MAHLIAEQATPARRPVLTGIFKTLTEQHRELLALLEREDIIEQWPLIRVELLSHERAEVRELYSVLREHAGLESIADHHDADAKEIEAMIHHLDAMEVASPAWARLFGQLADSVIEHALAEEQGIFPIAQRALGEARSLEIDERFRAAHRRIALAV